MVEKIGKNNIGCLVDWCHEQDMLFSLNPKQPKNDWVIVNLSNDNTGMVQLDFRRFVNLEVPYECLSSKAVKSQY